MRRMGACVAWKSDPVASPEPASVNMTYIQRLDEIGALTEAEALFDAFDRGEAFTGGLTAQEVVAEAKRRRGD
jgi:hypothetical protein